MRPYFAIIKDSFREAIASRVLWIVLALVTFLLIGLAPFTYREAVTVGVRENDVEAWPLLIEELREASELDAPNPAKRIVELLDDDGRQLVRDFKGMPEQPTMRDAGELQRAAKTLFASLDKVVRRDDFYDGQSWQGVAASRELKELQETPYAELSERDRLRFNRLLLEAAFPALIVASPPTSLQFRYAVWDLFSPFPIRKEQYTEGLLSRLPWLIDKGLLSIGLLIAVLVTAPVIPQMFDPGSLHLLLSKPIARPLLYLSKFAGGCSFVLLAAAYLFFGLWLMFGVQWGIWEPRLLWCIPIYAFAFATYYSVSALAGAVWRNTIVAVMLTILFWAFCFAIGSGESKMSGLIERYRIARLAPLDGELIAADELNTLLVWQDDEQSWKPLFTSAEHEQIRTTLLFLPVFVSVPLPDPIVGPVYDAHNAQIVAAAPSFKMLGRMTMLSARKGSAWKAAEGSPPSGQPIALVVEPDGHPLLIMNSGLSRVVRDLSSGAVMLRMPGFSIPLTRAEALESAGPTPTSYWGDPAAAALDPSDGRLLVYSRGMLTALQRGERGQYVVQREQRIIDDEQEPVVMAAGGGTCFVVRKDRQVLAIDTNSLETRETLELPGESPPRAALASELGDDLLVLTHGGYLYRLDADSRRFTRPKVRGQGDISAIAHTPDGHLLVASRATRVVEYDPGGLRELRDWNPPLSLQEKAYYWSIKPLHALLPKPGEFYKTVQYLLTGQATTADEQGNLSTAQARLDPWSPIWSGLAFQAVMLALGCLYIQRQEF